MRGESIPIRLFLAGYDLTPTMKDINKKFSVRYYLNLVLVDEEERRYFKQQVRQGFCLFTLLGSFVVTVCSFFVLLEKRGSRRGGGGGGGGERDREKDREEREKE